MRENRVGEFTRKLDTKCATTGRDVIKVDPAYTSQTCHVCHHVDPGSRVLRGLFICTNCNRVFHADVNAARNIQLRAVGLIVLRHQESSRGDQPKPYELSTIRQWGAP